MILILLNFILTACLIGETIYVDRVEGKKFEGTNPAISNVLLLAITVGMFSLFCLASGKVTPSLFTLLMRICLMLEGCMLVNIAFCFPYYAWNYSSGLLYVVKFLLYVLVGFFVFGKFKAVTITSEDGFVIESAYLFSGSARDFFKLTWEDLFRALFRYVFPLIGVLSMLIKNEAKSTKLDRHKGYVYAIGLFTMWILALGLSVVSRISPSYSLLHYFIYVPLLLILPYASWLRQAPSGRGFLSFIIKSFFFYFIPSVLASFAFMWIFHLGTDYGISLAVVGIIVMIVVVFIGRLLVKPLIKIGKKFMRSSDYAPFFERELASVDYSDDMDVIADNMYRIFNRNVEASSMAVYINGGNSTFECAYSSNQKKVKIDEFEPLFESLLNVGKNVLIYNEVDSMHVLSGMKKSLEKFFKATACDAMFILNEGRDVHGIIILGAKAGNDHYKDYDLNIFTKLYSYFFVFGYYMRNISNREIIGTVNRELKMSSQIITSIQENMDFVKNPKMDAGCIMVPAHNIGGEFVDMIRLTDTRHLFVMGDLSGKGIAASMSMVILKAIIRAFLAETHDFKQLVVKINQFVRNNLQKGTIFTGMFAIVNFENDTMYYINCGIPAIFLYTEIYNNVIEIQGSGYILGFVKDISPYISVKQIKLHKNDIVFTCTNGLIDSHSLRGEQFGKDRIQRNMVANVTYPASRMARFAFDELVRFMSHEMEDDVSVLIMKYLKDNDSDKIGTENSSADKTETEKLEPEPQNVQAAFSQKENEKVLEPSVGEEAVGAENRIVDSDTEVSVQKEELIEEEVPSFSLQDESSGDSDFDVDSLLDGLEDF